MLKSSAPSGTIGPTLPAEAPHLIVLALRGAWLGNFPSARHWLVRQRRGSVKSEKSQDNLRPSGLFCPICVLLGRYSNIQTGFRLAELPGNEFREHLFQSS